MPGMLAAGQRPHKLLVLWEAILGETVSPYTTYGEEGYVLDFTSPTTKTMLDAEMPACLKFLHSFIPAVAQMPYV